MEKSDNDGLQPQYRSYRRQKCFIGYSERAFWAEDLLAACQEVLEQPDFNLEADYARKHYVSDVSLRDKALELIANARYGIYDLSSWKDEEGIWQEPRNVYLELGMAIALNRPTLLLRHASNSEAGLELALGLASLDRHILEFSGYPTLKARLAEELTHWVKADPKRAWWNHYCHFGGRTCEYREAHPHSKQWGHETLHCHIADGRDVDQRDFRKVVEDVFERYDDIKYSYLDELSLKEGYRYLFCTYCQTARSTPFAVYRITAQTAAETFITIGMSIALEKQFNYKIPKIILTDEPHKLPSLLAGYEAIVARSYQERKAKLIKFVPAVLARVRASSWNPRPLPFHDTFVPGEQSSVDYHGEEPTGDKATNDQGAKKVLVNLVQTLVEISGMDRAAVRGNLLYLGFTPGERHHALQFRSPDDIHADLLQLVNYADNLGKLDVVIDNAKLLAQSHESSNKLEELKQEYLKSKVRNVPASENVTPAAEELTEKIFGKNYSLQQHVGREYHEDIHQQTVEILQQLIEDTLSPQEARILKLRYGLQDGQARTLKEVGEMFDLTAERIRMIETRALSKLRRSYLLVGEAAEKADKDVPLSGRQKSILDFIWQYLQENRRPPTIREIGRAVNISSTSVINYNLTKLKEKGFLDRDAELSRGLRLTKKAIAEYEAHRKRVISPKPETELEEEVKDTDDVVGEVPEDLDDAMAWLEELAARQGAPVEQVPTAFNVPESDEETTNSTTAAGRGLGRIWMDEATGQAYQDQTPILDLAPLERSVLQFLIQQPYLRHTKTDLIVNTWPDELRHQGVSDDSLYQVIASLRKKIEPVPSQPCYIVNWRGRPEGGYRFFPEGRPGVDG